jgi:putative peptide zinc metalloprotease protein
MTAKVRLIAIATTAVIAAAPLATAAPASAEGTSAVVVNQRDDSDVYRLMLQIRRALGDVVDTTNVAAAVASCDYCQTVAISLQGVLVMSDPSIFVPENLALAMNIDCDFCQTLASAYQTLVQTGEPVHFTPEGSQEIAEIRQELEALRNSGLSIVEIQQRVDELNTRLQQVLWTQVVPAGPPAGNEATPTTTPTTTQSAPADTGTSTTPTPTDASTTPTQSDTTATPTDTGTSTTPSDTGTTGSNTTTTDTTTTDTTTTGTTTTTTPTTSDTTTTTP